MKLKRWKEDWIHSDFKPSHIALARLFDGDELKAQIEFTGTMQRHFFVVRLFNQGLPSSQATRCRFFQDAKTSAELLSQFV